jgi:hypothetical protein
MEHLINYLATLDKVENDYSILSPLRTFVKNNQGYILDSGVCRACIYRKDWDFVFKFDKEPMHSSYCALESYHYAQAEGYGVQRVLLPISKFATLDNGIKIYRQTKYSYGWRDLPHQERRKLEQALKQMQGSKAYSKISRGMHHETDHLWRARATQLYGKNFMRSLQEWMDEYHINDLHIGNIGMYQGRPVLIDYAGYNGTDYQPSNDIIAHY